MLAWLNFQAYSLQGSLFIYQNGAQENNLTEQLSKTLTSQPIN
jgi:hypothetical protein